MMILFMLFVFIMYVCVNDVVVCVKVVVWWSVMGGVISVVGLMFGGLLIDLFGWCVIFFINLLICVFGLWFM